MFSTFDLCLLLYVIRLAGWLKHCNLSLSLSHIIGHTQKANQDKHEPVCCREAHEYQESGQASGKVILEIKRG